MKRICLTLAVCLISSTCFAENRTVSAAPQKPAAQKSQNIKPSSRPAAQRPSGSASRSSVKHSSSASPGVKGGSVNGADIVSKSRKTPPGAAEKVKAVKQAPPGADKIIADSRKTPPGAEERMKRAKQLPTRPQTVQRLPDMNHRQN